MIPIQESFWLTLEGIFQRLALLAKNYAYEIYGAIIRNDSDSEVIIWRTNPGMSETGPCPYCEGLNGTPFRRGEEPDYPAHLFCVCDLDPADYRSH